MLYDVVFSETISYTADLDKLTTEFLTLLLLHEMCEIKHY